MANRCKHESVDLTLELFDVPVWRVGVAGEEARKDEERSKTTWMGGVTIVCHQCGLHNRYTGSGLPKFVERALNKLPIWDRVERWTMPVIREMNRGRA